MPRMDGLQATKRFRAWEAAHLPQPHRLPVFALSANVYEEKDTECAAAGMDGARPCTRAACTAMPCADSAAARPGRAGFIPKARAAPTGCIDPPACVLQILTSHRTRFRSRCAWTRCAPRWPSTACYNAAYAIDIHDTAALDGLPTAEPDCTCETEAAAVQRSSALTGHRSLLHRLCCHAADGFR
jgi:CheY-like chemotaxis protein